MKESTESLKHYVRYLITESNITHVTFDEAIGEIAETIRHELVRNSPEFDEEPVFTGWCYDSINRKAVRSSAPDKFHPIYLYFEDDEESNGLLDTPLRITEGKTDEELKHDNIYIGVNFATLSRTNVRFSYYLEILPLLVEHELTHIMDMWAEETKNAISSAEDTGYTKINRDFFKSHKITVELSEETVQTIYTAFNIISRTEINAICNVCDTLISTLPEDEITEVISFGSFDDEKAEIFISKYAERFSFWQSHSNVIITELMKSLYSKNDISLSLLFAQTSVYMGFSEDETGRMAEDTWTFTDDILQGKRDVDRRTVETIKKAIEKFVSMTSENYLKVKKTVIDSLNERGLIRKSKLLESALPLHCANVFSKTKITEIPGYAGRLEMWLIGNSKILDEPVRDVSSILIEMFKSDCFRMEQVAEFPYAFSRAFKPN